MFHPNYFDLHRTRLIDTLAKFDVSFINSETSAAIISGSSSRFNHLVRSSSLSLPDVVVISERPRDAAKLFLVRDIPIF